MSDVPNVSIGVALSRCEDIPEQNGICTSNLHISVVLKDSNKSIARIPSDVVLVIDTSGSMGESSRRDENGEKSPLNILDVVKHAVRTVISTLNENDRLAIVSFSNEAQTICDLTRMTEESKTAILELLNRMEPDECTNLWAGLKRGIELLHIKYNPPPVISSSPVVTSTSSKKGTPSPPTSSKALAASSTKPVAPAKAAPLVRQDSITVAGRRRNSAVLLLTDGQPTPDISPKEGHVPALRNYCDTIGGKYPGIISTFGFSNFCDSALLRDLASEGGGMYSFIPDSGFVGTAFINSLANILTTFTYDARITVEPDIDGVTYVLFILWYLIYLSYRVPCRYIGYYFS